MIKRPLIILIFVATGLFNKSIAQDTGYFSITGKVNLLAGLELTTPIESYVTIKTANRFVIPDSLGNYKIDSLKAGIYKIAVQGFGYQQTDTTINVSKSITNLDLLIIAVCDINKDIAQKDIKENRPRLLIIGGIVPTIHERQFEFESKYGIKYYDYGDVPPAQECVEQYNKVIFDYLDNKFGKSWRREVRKDVIGFKRWK
jgi:hypothetical protein